MEQPGCGESDNMSGKVDVVEVVGGLLGYHQSSSAGVDSSQSESAGSLN